VSAMAVSRTWASTLDLRVKELFLQVSRRLLK
jgi:hypothetical protein